MVCCQYTAASSFAANVQAKSFVKQIVEHRFVKQT
jgi:hypothetical protein